MGRHADMAFIVVSLVAVAFLMVNWFSPIPLFQAENVQFTLVVVPSCSGPPAEHTVPADVTLMVQWNTTAQLFSPGGVWLNASAPPPNPLNSSVSVYVNYFTNVHGGGLFWFTDTVGGDYSFRVCAVGGAPDTPVFVNGSYVMPPLF